METQEHMCDECMFSIAQNKGIKLPNKFQCTICKEAFKIKIHFRMHEHYILNVKSLVFICEECNQVWTDEEIFENHMKQKLLKHICIGCNAKLEGKINLDAHFRARHRAF